MIETITKISSELYSTTWLTWHHQEQLIDQGTYTLTYGQDHYRVDLVITQITDDAMIYKLNFLDVQSGLNQIQINTESQILYEDPSTTPERLIWAAFQKTMFYRPI